LENLNLALGSCPDNRKVLPRREAERNGSYVTDAANLNSEPSNIVVQIRLDGDSAAGTPSHAEGAAEWIGRFATNPELNCHLSCVVGRLKEISESNINGCETAWQGQHPIVALRRRRRARHDQRSDNSEYECLDAHLGLP
jgi:hypothetical protein